MDRAYSLLTIKSVDEEQRILAGVATAPDVDRVGDVVVSTGVTYKNPMPLLWMHDSHKPVGTVIFNKPTEKGVTFEARIAKIAEPGILKDLTDLAWQSVREGLVRAVSIGFRSLENGVELLKGGGIRFLKTEVMEMSLVSIPALPAAQILSVKHIKSIDESLLAAHGKTQESADRSDPPPGAPGKTKPAAKSGFFFARSKDKDMKTRAEQIAALEAARAAKAARQSEVMQKSQDEGRSSSEDERDEFDTLESELKAADEDIRRLRMLEERAVQTATPVKAAAGTNPAEATANRGGSTMIAVKSNLPPGIAFAQYVKCLGLAHGNRMEAHEIAKGKPGLDPRVVAVAKANVVAGSTASGNWAANLVGDESSVYADFVEFLRPQTILGRFGANGVPSLRRIPFRVALVGQTGGGDGYWVGEGLAKPLTSFDFSRTTLTPLKVANIAVLTEEALRDSSPSADMIVRDSLVAALRARLDTDFISPTKAAVAGVSPGSITNGITQLQSSGITADDTRADVKAMVGSFISANNPPTSGVWIMSASTALSLSLMVNTLGQPEFNGISMNGGTFFGMPVITSEYMAADSNGSFAVLINASDIYLADEGGFMVDVSREASLLMTDNANANMNSTTPTGASVVSMFQTNSVAFRAERTIDWARRRASAVAVMAGVNWS